MPKVDKRAALAALKAARQSGAKFTYGDREAEQLYEEVDEAGYKKIVRDRLDQDDFVVDDNGEGYADDGREEWDRAPEAYSESEDDMRARRSRPGKAAKKAREDEQSKHDANNRNIADFLFKGAAKAQPKAKVVKTRADDDFLNNLLGEVDNNVPAPAKYRSKRDRSSERKRVRVLSPEPAAKKKKKTVDDRLPSPPMADVDDFAPIIDDEPIISSDMPMSDPAPSSPAAKVAERKSQVQIKNEPESKEEDDGEDMMEVARTGGVAATSVNMTGSRPPKKLQKPDPYPSPASSSPTKAPEAAVDSSAWNTVNDRLNVIAPATEARQVGKMDCKDAIEEDGSLNMFWTDYTEINGSLCLFGKVLNKKTRNYVSCFVKIDNIQRKLFFLPRSHRVQGGVETDDEIGMGDVFNEVDAVMTKARVKQFKIKPCTRKYAFELADIPKEAQYMKLFYPYTDAPIDMNTTGETFSRVFGANTALFEQFVLWKNIKGPCWLKIVDANFSAVRNSSHCKLEVLVDHPKMVETLPDGDSQDMPPLTLMSLAMRTVFNSAANKQEVLGISARIFEKVSIAETTPASKLPCRTFTAVRPNGTQFPIGFESEVKKRRKGLVKLFKTEQEVLQFFLAQVDIVDPDVILAHNFEGVDYSILLNRLHEKKIHKWSRLGRAHRSLWPSSMGKVGGNVFAERQVISGRLLCDLGNDAGKSIMFKCQSWSLSEMCSKYLPGDNVRKELDNEAALKTWATTPVGFMNYITHMETDTYFITALALQIQMLPLTKQLTNLAGNSWARTLTGTRAERNEYILLHEFHRNKYICPDKQPFRGRAKVDEEKEESAGGEGSKKDKFKGGLVFEPEKGLYDKFVLVMDFNSLYPSIIQEFNICFTTVDRKALAETEDVVPEVPQDQDQGVLPKLIATLVGRRREVKKLMKDKSATSEQLAMWDIKQLALKLTANSMYGCLGYTKSRFYARPLAVLTTFKGREILSSTKELAESQGLQVIYGDTDSVMINANVDNPSDAFKVGNEFKACVNERYKLLEIDIDNVFRRILLQAKKKYAAINLVEKDGKFIEEMEVKGLEIKRREYCALAHEILRQVLGYILSGEDMEVSVHSIHEYLRDISTKMREGAIGLLKYQIFTQLGKDPKDYPNGDSMPQVQVALREISRGKTVRRGDVISYIITGDKSSSLPAPKRAYTPADVVKPDSGLKPDCEWYLGRQIFPAVERLCANIAGTSGPQLAENLGIEVKQYNGNNVHSLSGPADLEIHPLESQIPDDVRFADCARLALRCRSCKETSPFEGLADAAPGRVTARGVVCPGCQAVLPPLSVVAQVEHAVRAETARYYEGWLVCDDAGCGARTRQMSVYGTRCLGPKGLARDCLGRMRYEYSEKAVYNQLVYFSSLWDVDKAKARVSAATAAGQEDGLEPGDRERVLALAEHNRLRFSTVKGVVDKYLDKCGRQWVLMDVLFAKLGFNKVQA